jgi:hypothetical protein
MVTDEFDTFRNVMLSNENLMRQFHRITHLPMDQFFASKYAAIGYFKEDVFYCKKRTDRIVKEF